jgi:uncharacterized cupin superfamily protein
MDSSPSFWIGPANSVESEVDKYDHSSEVFTFGRDLFNVSGLKRIGLHWEILPPGHRSTLPHAEMLEEEFVLVIQGHVHAWVNGVLHNMTAGDIAIFPAGTGIAHTIYNNGSGEAILFVGGERSVHGNRRYYPLNPEMKKIVGAAKWWDL